MCKSLQLCPTLRAWVYCSLPGSSVRGILQARILEWDAMPLSREPSRPRDQTWVSYVSCIGRWVLYHSHHLGSPPPYWIKLTIQTGALWPKLNTSESLPPSLVDLRDTSLWERLHVQLITWDLSQTCVLSLEPWQGKTSVGKKKNE